MGYQEKTVGGGPAKQLGADWTNFLQNFINSGSFGGGTAGQQFAGADPSGSTGGIFGLLNSMVSNPSADAGVLDLINRDIERGRNDLRARFGQGGGMGFGTPAAFAEALYQSEQAPRTAVAMDQMAQNRLASLMPLFGFANQIAGLGIPQAQTIMQPSPWMQGINLALDVANTAAKFVNPLTTSAETSTRTPTPVAAPQSTINYGGGGGGLPYNFIENPVRFPTPPVTRGTTSGVIGTPSNEFIPFGNRVQQYFY